MLRRIAQNLASEISSLENVNGVIFIGGLVRGFVDKFSDLDIIVFLSKKDKRLRKQICDLGSNAERQSGIDVDLEVHFLEDFEKWKWSEIDKWEFSKAEIIYDPQEKIKQLFKEKLKNPKDFWVKRIVICSEYLKWYCCPPKKNIGTIAEAWIERGDLVSAHYCLNYAADLLIRILFALNKEFLPAPKWRIHYSYGLRWLPANYKELIKKAMTLRSFSEEDFDRRLEAIRKIWQEIKPKIKEETGLTPKFISKYYVERVLHQK